MPYLSTPCAARGVWTAGVAAQPLGGSRALYGGVRPPPCSSRDMRWPSKAGAAAGGEAATAAGVGATAGGAGTTAAGAGATAAGAGATAAGAIATAAGGCNNNHQKPQPPVGRGPMHPRGGPQDGSAHYHCCLWPKTNLCVCRCGTCAAPLPPSRMPKLGECTVERGLGSDVETRSSAGGQTGRRRDGMEGNGKMRWDGRMTVHISGRLEEATKRLCWVPVPNTSHQHGQQGRVVLCAANSSAAAVVLLVPLLHLLLRPLTLSTCQKAEPYGPGVLLTLWSGAR